MCQSDREMIFMTLSASRNYYNDHIPREKDKWLCFSVKRHSSLEEEPHASGNEPASPGKFMNAEPVPADRSGNRERVSNAVKVEKQRAELSGFCRNSSHHSSNRIWAAPAGIPGSRKDLEPVQTEFRAGPRAQARASVCAALCPACRFSAVCSGSAE